MAATANTIQGGPGRIGGNVHVAAAGPTVDNDIDQGCSVGDFWIDTTNHKLYFCESVANSAAVWTIVN